MVKGTGRFARRALALAVLGTIVAPAAAVADPNARNPERDKQALIQLEEYWLAHEEDPEALETILADDFVHALPMGFISKEEHIDYWRKAHTPRPRAAKHFENLRVRIYGNVGIVNGIVVAADPNGPRKTVFTDVFAWRLGHWQAVNAQENPFQPPASK